MCEWWDGEWGWRVNDGMKRDRNMEKRASNDDEEPKRRRFFSSSSSHSHLTRNQT